MALYYPLVRSKSTEGCCFGKFLSTRSLQLVVPDGNELAFTEVGPGVASQPFRSRVCANGIVVSLHRISGDAFVSNKTPLDAILIYTRISSKLEDQLTLCRFNPESMQLETVGEARFPAPSRSSPELTRISVSEFAGPNLGNIIFSNGTGNKVYHINVNNFTNVSELEFSGTSNPHPVKVFWISIDAVVVVNNANLRTKLSFFKIVNKPLTQKLAKRPLKPYADHNLSLEVGEQVMCIGPMCENGELLLVFWNAAQGMKVSKKESKELEPKKLPFPPSSKRKWYLLSPHLGESQETYYISSDQHLLIQRKIGDPIAINPQNSVAGLITPVGPGVFKVNDIAQGRTRFVRYVLNKDKSNVVCQPIGPKLDLTSDLSLLAELPDSNGCIWRDRGLGDSGKLFLTESVIDVSTKAVAFQGDGIFSKIWKISSNPIKIIVGMANEIKGQFSGVFEVNDHQLNRVNPSWLNIDVHTIYADSRIQVTPNEVFRADGTSTKVNDLVSAWATDSHTIWATSSTVTILKGVHELFRFDVNDSIIAVSIMSKQAAVLTSKSLILVNVDTQLTQEKPVPHVCSSLLISSKNQVYVGTNNGSVINFTSDSTTKVCNGPIKNLFSLENGSIIGSDVFLNSYLITEPEGPKKLSIGGLDSVIDLSGCFLVVRKNKIELLSYRLEKPLKYQTIEIPNANPGDIFSVFQNKTYAIDNCERTVSVASVTNLADTSIFKLPSFEREIYNSQQLFMLGSTKVLEVAYKEPVESFGESDLESDAEEDYFGVDFEIRLYELRSSGKCDVVLLDKKNITLDGDPYEEIHVKFFTPQREGNDYFHIFTHGAESVTGQVINNQIHFNAKNAVTEEVYDDLWILNDTNRTVTVFEWSGKIYSQDVSNLSSTPDIGNSKSQSAFPTDNGKINVYEVIVLDSHSEQHNFGTIYAAAIRYLDNDHFTEVQIFYLQDSDVKVISKFQVPQRKVKLTPATASTSDSGLYLKLLVGSSDGALYVVRLFNELETFNKLKEIEQELLNDLNFVETLDQFKGSAVDGSLLIDAFNLPELSYLFEDRHCTQFMSNSFLSPYIERK